MKHDNDAALDRVLGPTLKGRDDAPPDPACLDADTLAAWADDGLDAVERKAVETHAAGCGRCQALLAAMVRTVPPPEAAASPARTRAFWWLAAMAPIAAALLIWVAVPAPPPVQRSQSAEAAAEQSAPASPGSVAPRPQADAPTTEAGPPRAVGARASRAAAPLEEKTAAPPSANKIASADTLAPAAQDAAPLAASAPPPAAAGAAAAAEAAPRRDVRSSQARVSMFAAAMDNVVVSSNPSTRFRLLPGGGVQRSADGGATWRNEVTGAADTLIAGSSPSPSVCWLIGLAGTVLRSTDGRSWVRVPFPEAVDLRAVTASDADTATVTTADGRAFATTDGGQTWSRPPDF